MKSVCIEVDRKGFSGRLHTDVSAEQAGAKCHVGRSDDDVDVVGGCVVERLSYLPGLGVADPGRQAPPLCHDFEGCFQWIQTLETGNEPLLVDDAALPTLDHLEAPAGENDLWFHWLGQPEALVHFESRPSSLGVVAGRVADVLLLHRRPNPVPDSVEQVAFVPRSHDRADDLIGLVGEPEFLSGV